MSKIVIINYGLGNLRSVQKTLERLNVKSLISSDQNEIALAEKLILPGVGNFKNGITNIHNLGLINILHKKVLEEKIPVLGICLGMQLFSRFSEEGDSFGLGWLDADTVRFRLSGLRHKVPQIGWNSIDIKKGSPIMKGFSDESQFYFVHSYHIKCNCDDDILATTEYGYEFVSAIQRDNIFGTQFHPEKSHGAGEMLLRNFISL